MSNIRVSTTDLMQILEMTPAHHNLMLVGRHGIGKSEILTEYFAKQGMPVVALFLGQMADPGDLIGIPSKNEQTGKTEFMPPLTTACGSVSGPERITSEKIRITSHSRLTTIPTEIASGNDRLGLRNSL